jgi:HTH-type transcriptional regulator, repressor for puuD
MAVFVSQDFPMVEISPGVRGHRVVDQPQGSGAVTVGELVVAPGAGLARHRHKVEEAIIVVEGRARFTLEDVATEVGPGTMLLAPAGQPHSLDCIGSEALRIYFVFPAVNVEREWV